MDQGQQVTNSDGFQTMKKQDDNNVLSLQAINNMENSNSPLLQPPVKAGELPKIRQTGLRWFTLAVSCLILIGSYMSYDFASFLKDQVMSTFHLKNDEEFNLIYSVYSLPNTIVPFVGGFVIDKLGIRIGNFVFVSIILVGQSVVFVAAVIRNFPTLLGGRAFYSLGDENLGVCQSAIVSKWFYGKELGFAMGINVSFSRLGSVLSGWVLQPLYDINDKLWTPILFLLGMITFSFICANILNLIDKATDDKEARLKKQLGIIEEQKTGGGDDVNIRDVLKFPLIFWWIVLSCVLNYICLFVFVFNAKIFLEERYHVKEDVVTKYMTIPYLMAACLTPFVGLLVDLIGSRVFLLFGSSCIMTLAHVLFLILPHNTKADQKAVNQANFIVPLVLLGLFYSVYAAVLWPCIPIVLKEEWVGTGFGVATAVQNIGLTIVPLLYGAIDDGDKTTKGQNNTEIMFIALGVTAILTAFLIYFEDKIHGNSKLQSIITQNKKDETKQEEQQKIIRIEDNENKI